MEGLLPFLSTGWVFGSGEWGNVGAGFATAGVTGLWPRVCRSKCGVAVREGAERQSAGWRLVGGVQRVGTGDSLSWGLAVDWVPWLGMHERARGR